MPGEDDVEVVLFPDDVDFPGHCGRHTAFACDWRKRCQYTLAIVRSTARGLMKVVTVCCLLIALPAVAATPDDAATRVKAAIDRLYPDIEQLYIELHQHPELSLHEEKTSATMAARLKKLGFEVTTGVGGYGVVGLLRNGAGPTLLLRTDMDALPVKE